jgi:hypothetical protein
VPLSHWTQLTQRRLLKSKAPVNVVKSIFIYSLAQKTQNFRFFFYKKNNLFFYVFISFLKQFQKYSLRSYFQDLGFAFYLVVSVLSLRSLLLLFQGALDNRFPRLQTKKNVSCSLSSFTTPFSSLFLPCLLFKYLSRHNRF